MGGNGSKSVVYSVPVDSSNSVLGSSIYRHPDTYSSIVLPKVWGFSNFFELFRYFLLSFSCGKFAFNSCFGSRLANNFEWISYAQANSRVLQTATLLDSLQISENSLGMNLVGILSSNRKEWIYISIACMGIGLVTSGLSDTDTDEDLGFKLEALHLKYICVDKEGLLQVLRLKKNRQANDLEVVICLDRAEDCEKKIAGEVGFRLIQYKDFKNLEGKPNTRPIETNDTCMVAFTSGTTGMPKLVKVSHENLMGTFTALLHGSYKISPDDIHLTSTHFSILSETILIYIALISGASIGISNQFQEDLKIVRPTIIFTLPRYLDFLYIQIQDEISLQSQMLQKLFNKSFAKKLMSYSRGEDLKKSFWDNMTFKNIREKLGGRVRLIFTGMSLTNTDNVKFFKIVLGCDIIESYGNVEAGEFILCAGRDRGLGHVGGPLASCEVKLQYCADVNIEGLDPLKYGELCIRNSSTPAGYLDKPSVDSEGWVHSGDLFCLNEELASFKFIDRIEYIMKNKAGKSITPQVLEMIYRQSELVAQIIVFADYRINGLVAIVVPDERIVLKSSDQKNFSYSEVCASENFAKNIIRSLNDIAISRGRKDYEKVRKLIVEPVPWTSQEFITKTLKLRRNAILAKYSQAIQDLISELIIAN